MWLQKLWVTNNFKLLRKNCLLDAGNWIFQLHLSHSLIFFVPEDVRLNPTHYLIMEILNKKELQIIAINHSADIDYKDFVKICRSCTKEPFNFLTIDTTLPTCDP